MESKKKSDLRAFFEPRGVAVIGSLREGRGEGYWVIKNMLHFGFTGNIYPINPLYSEVLGIRAYPTVSGVSEPIDLAIVITPPPSVPGIIEQCAQKGVKGAIIASEGFAEASEAGARLQQQLVDIARNTGIRLIGPNTIGTVNTSNGLVTNQYAIDYGRVRKGNIAYVSQSGIVGAQAQPLEDRAYYISKMCDLGNKCDVSEVDLLDYLISDSETEVIALHLEAVKDGRGFLDVLRKAVARKPVLIFKAGRTEQGARASASHTGSLAGSEPVYSNVFKQVGAIPVKTWQEFWEVPKVFAYRPLPTGNRIAIVTPTGGAGVVAVDTAVEAGLDIAQLSGATTNRLARFAAGLARNPLDLGPTLVITDDRFSLWEAAIAAVLDDANVDCVAVFLYAGAMLSIPDTVSMFDRLRRQGSKPVTIWIYGTRSSLREELSRKLEGMGLPTYLDLEMAIKALGIAANYAKFKAGLGNGAPQ